MQLPVHIQMVQKTFAMEIMPRLFMMTGANPERIPLMKSFDNRFDHPILSLLSPQEAVRLANGCSDEE